MSEMQYERWFAIDYQGQRYWVRAWEEEEALATFKAYLQDPTANADQVKLKLPGDLEDPLPPSTSREDALFAESANYDWSRWRDESLWPEDEETGHFLSEMKEDLPNSMYGNLLAPWIFRLWKQGEVTTTTGANRYPMFSGGQYLYQIADTLTNRLKEYRKHFGELPDIRSLNSLDALNNLLDKGMSQIMREHFGQVLFTFPDGWTVRKLRSQRDADWAGRFMDNCVAQEWTRHERTLALVDPKTTTHVIWAEDGGAMQEIAGKGNEEPVQKYVARIRYFNENRKDRPKTYDEPSIYDWEQLPQLATPYDPYGAQVNYNVQWDELINDALALPQEEQGERLREIFNMARQYGYQDQVEELIQQMLKEKQETYKMYQERQQDAEEEVNQWQNVVSPAWTPIEGRTSASGDDYRAKFEQMTLKELEQYASGLPDYPGFFQYPQTNYQRALIQVLLMKRNGSVTSMAENKEFPMVQRLDQGKWQREFTE